MQDYSPIPTSPTEDTDDIYSVVVNLILNTRLSLVSKKAIKLKIKEFQKQSELDTEEIPFSTLHTHLTKTSENDT